MLGIWAVNLARNVNGQDLIEYALMAGFVSNTISTVFSKIGSVMADAAAS
jgi:Flp pilus assembly pilin Flp